MKNSDNDFPLCMSFFSIEERLRHLGEWVSPVESLIDNKAGSTLMALLADGRIVGLNEAAGAADTA